jgi:MerR family transcriptional regulator, copper efflux regulator
MAALAVSVTAIFFNSLRGVLGCSSMRFLASVSGRVTHAARSLTPYRGTGRTVSGTGVSLRRMATLTIGTLAKQAGVGVETVRFYERRGLVRRPVRPGSGYRAYSEEIVKRIHFIRNAQALGFTLKEIKDLLALRVTVGTSCAAVRSRAAAKVADVQQRLDHLSRIKSALENLVAACPGRGALLNCTILDALDSKRIRGVSPRGQSSRKRTKGNAGMKSVKIKIHGMQCEGCASTIQTVLSREPGVKSSSVSFPKRSASVFFDPDETDAARLADAVKKAGFTAEARQ